VILFLLPWRRGQAGTFVSGNIPGDGKSHEAGSKTGEKKNPDGFHPVVFRSWKQSERFQ
jgi:hypothetical protein